MVTCCFCLDSNQRTDDNFCFTLLIDKATSKGEDGDSGTQRVGIWHVRTGRKPEQLGRELEGTGDHIPRSRAHPSVSSRHHLEI